MGAPASRNNVREQINTRIYLHTQPLHATPDLSSTTTATCVLLQMLQYTKNPCPCGNRTFPNNVHHQGLGSTRQPAQCLPGSDHAPCRKWAISTWAWVLAFIPPPARNIKAAMWKSHISKRPFSAWIVLKATTVFLTCKIVSSAGGISRQLLLGMLLSN